MQEELDHRERISKLESDVHNISSTVTKLFEKFDDLVDKVQPKQLGASTIITMIVSGFTLLAMLMASMIWIVNSMNAPLITQQAQTSSDVQVLRSTIMNNAAMLQLTNKEVAGISSSNAENTETIRWMLFDKDLPGQLTSVKKDIEYLKSHSHLHKSMVNQ